ncbi:tetratricopeptide repeat protein [Roseomonas sp. CCTCC AB2023176]|uniref:tetratricopeptide repeat protein n=1 Tax=Roseomonas sp. CCTCC AB2023176 TaxID=3342640 RepID=UPI0035D67224
MSTTTTADALREGDLAAAVASAQAKVKAAPRDQEARWLLAEVLLLQGDADRADKMLDAAVLDEPVPAVLEFRRLLRAEVARQQMWKEGGRRASRAARRRRRRRQRCAPSCWRARATSRGPRPRRPRPSRCARVRRVRRSW